jgi:hypothetical protein
MSFGTRKGLLTGTETMTAYTTTTVPVERSKKAIRDLLIKHKARGVQFGEDFIDHKIMVRFAMEVEGNFRTVNMTVQVPTPAKAKRRPRVIYRYNRYSQSRVAVRSKSEAERWDQMERATYRFLHYMLKAQFEAVEFGLFSMTDMFLSHFEWILDGKQTTVGAALKDHLDGSLRLMPPSHPQTDATVDGDYREA